MTETVLLWPNGAPGSERWHAQERDHVFTQPWRHRIIRNVSVPTLTAYLPEAQAATGTGVVICPGGAHHILAMDHEGHEVAQWLAERGIAGFVLKYRVIPTPDDEQEFRVAMSNIPARLQEYMPAHWPLALADGQRAMGLVREHAQEWGVRPDRIGIMGFSAGGHLAAGVALADEASSRPDFVAPIYPVLREAIVVPANVAPLFVAVASNDALAVTTSLMLYSAWREAGQAAELHCFAQGGHGFGMVHQGFPSDDWIERMADWLAAQGLVARRGS
jgi:acetyl esterase/lipase